MLVPGPVCVGRLAFGVYGLCDIITAGIVSRLLERGFFGRARRASQIPARSSVVTANLGLAELAQPAAEFVAVEVRVSAVNERCERTIVEGQQRGVCAFAR